MYLHSPAQSGSTTLCFLFCASVTTPSVPLMSTTLTWPPAVSVFARHARVDKDVLELPVPWPPGRAHAKTGPAIADAQVQSRTKMRYRTVIASRARRHLQAGRLGGRVRRDHLHEVPHDTETQATRQIDAPTTPAGLRQLPHRLDMLAGKPRLTASSLHVQLPHGLGRGGQALRRLLEARCGERHGMEPAGDARPVPFESGQDLAADAHSREAGVEVGRVFVGDDLPLPQELANLAFPDAEHRPHELTAPLGHAAQPREPAPTQ